MRIRAAARRASCLGLVALTGLLSSTCGGGSDVAGPDRVTVAAARPAATAPASGDGPAADGSEKSEVCHLDTATGTYELLSLGPNALGPHLAHGDLVVETRYLDSDGDGYGSGPSFKCPATTSTRFATLSGDCDDGDPAIRPGVPDNTEDGLDNDCDGQIDEDAHICPCASFFPGKHWVDQMVASQKQRTGDFSPTVSCPPIVGYNGTSSLLVSFIWDGGGVTSKLFFFSNLLDLKQCGFRHEIFVGSNQFATVESNIESSLSATQIQACEAQIRSSATSTGKPCL